jgi:hypothetical protein
MTTVAFRRRGARLEAGLEKPCSSCRQQRDGADIGDMWKAGCVRGGGSESAARRGSRRGAGGTGAAAAVGRRPEGGTTVVVRGRVGAKRRLRTTLPYMDLQ